MWITKECEDLGSIITKVEKIEMTMHKQALIYYKSGLNEVDKVFQDSYYFRHGYICEINFQVNGVVLYFNKYEYNSDYIKDFGMFIINRESLIEYNEYESEPLEFVKFEQYKHRMKYMTRKAFGLTGELVAAIGKKVDKLENTYYSPAIIFNVKYYDQNNEIKTIEFYTLKEYSDEMRIIFNMFFVRDLEEELKNINPNSESSCFIATACYNNLYCPEVMKFREFRDKYLLKNEIGCFFVKLYYNLSPRLIKILTKQQLEFVKINFLDRIYKLITKHKL